MYDSFWSMESELNTSIGFTRNTVSGSSGPAISRADSLDILSGPVVRIGPNEVDVSDCDAVREIHRVKGGFTKSAFYATGGRIQSMFSTRDRNFHTSRRRLLGPCFTEASLNSLQPVVNDLARLVISKMREEAMATGSVDILKWWTLFAMDVIGQLSFGESFGMVQSGKASGNLVKRKRSANC